MVFVRGMARISRGGNVLFQSSAGDKAAKKNLIVNTKNTYFGEPLPAPPGGDAPNLAD